MKALWRGRPPTGLRRVGATYAALAVALGSPMFLYVPHFAWLCPVLALCGSLAAFVLALVARFGRDTPVDLRQAPAGVEVWAEGEAAPALLLRGADLLGVSTCEGARGVDVAITHRAQPHKSFVFEGVAPSEVEPLRRALGLPQGGFGGTAFPQGTSRTLGSSLSGVASFWFGIVFAFFGLGVALEGAGPVAVVLTAFTILGAPLAFFVWLAQRLTLRAQRGQRSCTLRPDGFTCVVDGAERTLRYTDIATARLERAGIGLHTTDGKNVYIALGLVSVPERQHLLRQLLSARDRAVAAGTATSVEESLRSFLRRPGEPLVGWLARVDSISVLPGEGAALYRSAGIPERDLWAALDDPDLPVELRSAVARRLCRVDPSARVRVESTALRLHAEDEQARFRVVVDMDPTTQSEPLSPYEETLRGTKPLRSR